MLQSFSQFLPSALQLGDSHARTATPNIHEENKQLQQHPAPKPEDAGDHAGEAKKKARKEKPANETFIFVRPPPAKNNHPLNLQVQLVPPSAKTRAASDASSRPTTPSGDDTELTRVQSSQSSQSAYSQPSASNSSISSYASNGTSGSGRRMIIPLYNLQAHNVLTNTVVDAGTDAKVAKFKGRGVEILGLATLEPVEVWGDAFDSAVSPGSGGGSARTSIDQPGSALSHGTGSASPSPPASTAATPTRAPDSGLLTPTATPTGARKMFGKMFRRGARPASIAASPGSSATVTLDSPRTSLALPNTPLTPTGFPLPASPLPASPLAAEANTPALRPPILGITPTFASPAHPPVGRPGKYVWVVRRWLKGADTGLLALGGRVRALGKDGAGDRGVAGLVEVRFEWTRGRTGAGRKRGGGGRRQDSVGSGGERRDRERLGVAEGGRNRLSMMSQQTATSDSHGHSPPHDGDDGGDSGDESDPEDSETPWTCALAVRRLPSSPAPPATATAPPTSIRLKIGTLSPTPHHPKVVSMLKIPYPLPDIDVERAAVHRRGAAAAGGLVLTAEEIKDVISCTGLWLVVREGFGGVGRVGRKGDGWRIRA
ncbi:hypothetical protein HWV62_28236 [Athelia sp. TMB]|nr:hypothetical protein HWV62_28236 [Athelia sp. TMB]